jgi:hypothetical protein
MRRTFRDVGEALNLRPEEEAQLIALLAEYELRDAENPPDLPQAKGRTDVASQREMMRALQQEMLRRYEEKEKAIAELLGEARYAGWQDFLQSMGVRGQVRQLQDALADTPAALPPEQTRLLTAALVAENKKFYSGRTTETSTREESMAMRVAAWERAEKTTEEYIKRMRIAAAPYLPLPAQSERFDDLLHQQLEDVRSNLQMIREEAKQKEKPKQTPKVR